MPKWGAENRGVWFKDTLDRLRSWTWIRTCPIKQAWIFSKTGKHSTWHCYLYWYVDEVHIFRHSNKE